MDNRWMPVLFLLFLTGMVRAQITPPSMTHNGSATWTALGASQQLKKEQNTVMVYSGLGSGISREHEKPKGYFSMWVLNAELKHKFSGSWYASGALSYRRHKLSEPPADEVVQQEVRLYASAGRKWKVSNWSFSLNLRPELRTFYNRSFQPEEDFLSLRYRLRLRVGWNPAASKQHLISVSAEGLSSSEMKNEDPLKQTTYDDTRFCLYYSYSPNAIPLVFELGYMADVRVHHDGISSYLGLDVIWKNPFHT